MRLLGFMVAVLLGVLAGAPSSHAQTGHDFGRYVALVIGNNDYRNLTKKTAVGDARAVADLLRARYDFQVELLLNADRDAIIRAVNGYRAKLHDTDRVWGRYEEAYQASSIESYTLKSLTPDEISISLDYMAHSTAGSYASGRTRLRTRGVRFRNRAPGFAILQWGTNRVDTSVTDASQIDIHWEVISERVVAQYNRALAIADGAADIAGIDSYRLDRLDAGEIALTIEFRVNPIASGTAQPKSRTVDMRLRNKAPDFRILKWGSLPVSATDDEDLTMTSLLNEQLTVAITYAVSGGGSTERNRDATVTLRNAGLPFEVLEWRR